MLCLLLIVLQSCRSVDHRLKRIEQSFHNQWEVALPSGPGGQPLPDAEAVKNAWQLCNVTERKLAAFDPERLQPATRSHLMRFRSEVNDRRAFLLRLRHNPASYNLGEHLQFLLNQETTLTESRWMAIDSLLHRSDDYYDQAKKILETPEYSYTLAAIAKQQQTLSWLNQDLLDSLDHSSLDDRQKNSLRAGIVKAGFAVKDYLAFCRSLAIESQDSTFQR